MPKGQEARTPQNLWFVSFLCRKANDPDSFSSTQSKNCTESSPTVNSHLDISRVYKEVDLLEREVGTISSRETELMLPTYDLRDSFRETRAHQKWQRRATGERKDRLLRLNENDVRQWVTSGVTGDCRRHHHRSRKKVRVHVRVRGYGFSKSRRCEQLVLVRARVVVVSGARNSHRRSHFGQHQHNSHLLIQTISLERYSLPLL